MKSIYISSCRRLLNQDRRGLKDKEEPITKRDFSEGNEVIVTHLVFLL